MSEYTDEDNKYDVRTDEEHSTTDEENDTTDEENNTTDEDNETDPDVETYREIEQNIRTSQLMMTDDKELFMAFLHHNEYILRALNISLFSVKDKNKYTACMSNVIEIIPYDDMKRCYYIMSDDALLRSRNEYVTARCIIPRVVFKYEEEKEVRRLTEYDITNTEKKKHRISKKVILNYYKIEYNYNDGVFYKVF